jgi:hypothetical protein
MTSTGTSPDDLDAVRTITEALKGFQPDEQRRILRWAQEKLGLAATPSSTPPPSPGQPRSGAETSPAAPRTDIKTFLQAKRPASDVQFAAAVAYYFMFEATAEARKEEIAPSDLQDAARLSGRTRLSSPRSTLNNAVRLGYLDRGQDRGTFRINTVGENLVAMAMPAGEERVSSSPRPKGRGGAKSKKSSRKRA